MRQRCVPVVQSGPLLDGAWEEEPITLDGGAEADEDDAKDEPGSWLLGVMMEELPSALLEGALHAPGWLVTVPEVDAPELDVDVLEVAGLDVAGLEVAGMDVETSREGRPVLELLLLAAEDGLGPLLFCALELAEDPNVVLLDVPDEKLLPVPDEDVAPPPHNPITHTRPEAQSWLLPHVSRQVPPEHAYPVVQSCGEAQGKSWPATSGNGQPTAHHTRPTTTQARDRAINCRPPATVR